MEPTGFFYPDPSAHIPINEQMTMGDHQREKAHASETSRETDPRNLSKAKLSFGQVEFCGLYGYGKRVVHR